MIVAIYDKAGKLVLYMDAPEDQIAANVPEGGRFEEVPLERMTRLAERQEDSPQKDPAP